MSLVELQNKIQKVCLDEHASTDILEALGDAQIFTVYRNMVRRRFYSELKFALKHSHHAAGDDLFQTMFNSFMADAAVRTRYFYRVPVEFVSWLLNEPALFASAPTYLRDLLAFEAGRWEVSDLPGMAAGGTTPEIIDFSFDLPLALNPTVTLVAVSHAVEHPENRDQKAAKGDVLFFRCSDDAPVQFFRVNGVTAEILRHVQKNMCSIGHAARTVTDRRKIRMDPPFVDGLCGVLADFLERGVILGSYASKAT